MMIDTLIKYCLVWTVASLSASAVAVTQHELNQLGRTLDVQYQVLDNIEQTACESEQIAGHCFSAQIRLQTEDVALTKGTVIHFSHITPIAAAQSNAVSISHINGDHHEMRITRTIPANTTETIRIAAPAWHAARSDIMPNYYLVADALAPVTIDSTVQQTEPGSGLPVNPHAGSWTKPNQYRRNADDVLPLQTSRAQFAALPEQWPAMTANRVVPQVKQRQDSLQKRHLTGIKLPSDAAQLAPWLPLVEQLGLPVGEQQETISIVIAGQQFSGPEHYALRIEEQAITLTAASDKAAGYGLLTLAQLRDPQTGQVPLTTITDAPRFAFRGVHFDIARSFTGYDSITMLLEQMAILKLNKLHLHVSDDEGWRLEIPGLPELTEVGAYRCHDESEQRCLMPQLGSGPHRDAGVNGYLSVQQYKNLLQLANQWGIEVIPSLDMPGHSRAAIKAMEARYNRLMAENKPEQAEMYLLTEFSDKSVYSSIQHYSDNTLNPCLPSTFRFIDKLLAALKVMHQQAGVPLTTYHIGADETAGAWTQSAACKSSGIAPHDIAKTFIREIIKLGNSKGLVMAGWSDGMMEALPALPESNVYVNVWQTLPAGANKTVSQLAASNTPAVLSLPDVLYFDFPYQNDPLEPGYYWGAKSVSLKRVFGFMPQYLGQHAELWTDRMGQPYDDEPTQNATPVLGMQAQLWTEITRDQRSVEYMLFPRLLAFAERAWHQAEWEGKLSQAAFLPALNRDFSEFTQVVAKRHYSRLVKADINVRIPPPGYQIDAHHQLELRAAMPNLKLEYSADAMTWHTYTGAVSADNIHFVRARLINSPHTSRIIAVEP